MGELTLATDSRAVRCCYICGNTPKQVKDLDPFFHAHVWIRYKPSIEKGG